MSDIHVRFLGTGDAFGHGGRLQPCILVKTPETTMLMDCGATATLSMNRFQVPPNSIDLIVISHLHGDHFSGLPVFILDAQLHSKRTAPLVIAGPTGIRDRLPAAMEVLFAGSSKIERKFPVYLIELTPDAPWRHRDVTVHVVEGIHPSGAPSLALRLECGGKSVAYTGDTEWTDALIPALQEADLLVAEAYFYDKQVKYHLNHRTLTDRVKSLNPKRVFITHMSQDMLDHLGQSEFDVAEDGLEFRV